MAMLDEGYIDIHINELKSIVAESERNKTELRLIRNAVDCNVPVEYIRAMIHSAGGIDIDDFVIKGSLNSPYYGKEEESEHDT